MTYWNQFPTLPRVQDYILRNQGSQFYVFINPGDTIPQISGDVEIRTSPYLQKGQLLVIDKLGFETQLLRRLESKPARPSDLIGLAARESL